MVGLLRFKAGDLWLHNAYYQPACLRGTRHVYKSLVKDILKLQSSQEALHKNKENDANPRGCIAANNLKEAAD